MKKILTWIFVIMLCLSTVQSIVFAAQEDLMLKSEKETLQIAQNIINWKKLDNGSSIEGNLINDKFLELAGSTPGDWFVIGLGRLGIKDANDAYLAVIKDIVETRYKQQGKLSSVKSTEWHRISLAVLSMGGDPTSIGKDENGNPINLIADGSYDRGKVTSLGRQGINGWIWGLLTVDSMRYEIPEGSYYSRDDIIIEILRQQLSDGGFALSGSVADTDITAMALQSLAPYYNSEKIYTYEQKSLEKQVSKTVRQVVDESLSCLSKLQFDDGDFKSWGTENVESTNQVVVALCSLGIDPQTDTRFIKKGKTLIDGILKYKMPDGGFIHSLIYDEDNPTAIPNESNSMASEQTLYTMAAVIRQMNNERRLYDFRAEQSTALKTRISDLKIKIDSITNKTDKNTLTKLLEEFYSIPENERDYVSNYWTLSDMAKSLDIDVNKIADETTVVESPADKEDKKSPFYFTDSDKEVVSSLPEKLTTEQYVVVVKLLDKLNQCEDSKENRDYINKLTTAKEAILIIQNEIDSINEDILSKLYPFDKMTLKDKAVIDSIVKRYKALSTYDQAKIERFEDVIKTKTKIDNELRAIIISMLSVIVCVLLAFFIIRNIKKRKRAKVLAMEELAAEYEDE